MKKEAFTKKRLEDERKRLHIRVKKWMKESLGCALMAENMQPDTLNHTIFSKLSEIYKEMALDAYRDYEYIRDAKYVVEADDLLNNLKI